MPAVVAAWAVIFEVVRFARLIATDPANNDFRLFYISAKAGLTWGWASMYDPGRLGLVNDTVGPARYFIYAGYTYLNPPIVAWLAAPLTAFPLGVGLAVWVAVNATALVCACRLVFPERPYVFVAVALGSLAVWPTAFSFERGQPEGLVFGLAAGSWWLASRRRQREAGLALALAWALKPQDLILLPAALLLAGYVRVAAWWLLGSTALWVVFALVIGPVGLGTYLGVTDWALSSSAFTASPLVAPFGPAASLLLQEVILAGVSVAAAWRHRRSLRLVYGIGIVGTLASTLHLHEYDLVGLAVAAWLVYGEAASAGELAWLAAGIVCAQLPAIGVRLPILVWQIVWLGLLWLRSPAPREKPLVAGAPAARPAASG